MSFPSPIAPLRNGWLVQVTAPIVDALAHRARVRPGRRSMVAGSFRGGPGDLVRLVGLAAVTCGLAVMAGWWQGIDVLKAVVPGLPTMKPFTAAGFVGAGFVLLAPERLRQAIGLAVAGLGIVNLLQWLLGTSFGIDELMMSSAVREESIANPGRMATATALAFGLFGAAAVVRSPGVRQALAFGVLMIALAALQLHGLGRIATIAPLASVALHTAVLFLLLSLALMVETRAHGLVAIMLARTISGTVARDLAALTLGGPVVLTVLFEAGLSRQWWDPVVGQSVMTLIAMTALLIVAWAIAGRTLRMEAETEASRAGLRRLGEELERRVEERTRALVASNRELEALSYSIAHDLRSPLRAINAAATMLLEDDAAAGRDVQRARLSRIGEESLEMGRMIDGLLEFARLARSTPERRPVQLSTIAAGIMADLQAADGGRPVECVIEPGIAAQCDPVLARVLVQNLLGNAWKFTRGREPARIEFGVERGTGRETFFVRDNGAGFDMRYAKRLFGPFERLHSKIEFPGSGIGLALCKRIVELHGGAIRAESSIGRGTTVYFSLAPA